MTTQISSTVETLTKQYAKCNLLLPSSNSVEVSPFYRFTVSEINADTSANSGDIFYLGQIKTGTDSRGNDKFESTYALAKPFLMRLATAAGIQFHPEYTGVRKEDANTFVGRAYGAIRLPDGTYKTHMETKSICLNDEEERLRLDYMDKSIMGISKWKAAKEAEKMFAGYWKTDPNNTDKDGRPIKMYVIADKDRQKYIERSVLVSMTQLRKTVAEKAQTGAILRVIRALLGIKGAYRIEELKKPFAVISVNFQPDYNDKMVKNALLQQGMRSMTNLFGISSVATPFGSINVPTPDTSVENFTMYDGSSKEYADEEDDVEQPKAPETPTAPVKQEAAAAPAKTAAQKATKVAKEQPAKDSDKPASEPKMTVKEAKKYQLPEDDPFYAGLTLEEVIQQPGGVDYLKTIPENPEASADLLKAANLMLKAISYMQSKSKQQ